MFMKFAPPVTARTNPAGKGTQSLAGTLKQKIIVSMRIFVNINMKCLLWGRGVLLGFLFAFLKIVFRSSLFNPET